MSMNRRYLATVWGLVLLLLFALSMPLYAAMDTFAGGNVCDGGPATMASLNIPMRIAQGPAGEIYVADSENHRIRKIDSSGNITTVAGNGKPGNSGDYGPAVEASLHHPTAIAFGSDGELYIADSDNHHIRKVTATGIIVPVAGTGTQGFGGDGNDARSALLSIPRGITFDASGNLYIADTGNNRIRRVSPSGIITTVVGNGSAGYYGDGGKALLAALNQPRDVEVDDAGNIYIADTLNNRVRKVFSDTKIIRTIAGSGEPGYSGDGMQATNASLFQPRGIFVGNEGVLYIADTKNNRIRRVSSLGIITTAVGNGSSGFAGDGGKAKNASIYWPYDVYMTADGIPLVVDTNNSRIRAVNSFGTITTYAGNGEGCFSGDGGPASMSGLNFPTGIAVDVSTDDIYIADTINHRIRKINSSGIITTVAGDGSKGFGGDGGNALSASLNSPHAAAVGTDGNLYIADTGNHRIRMVDSFGIITTVAGSGVPGFDGDGGLATEALLNNPKGVSVYEGGILVADTQNNRIRSIDSTGIISTIAGSGTAGFSGDSGLAVGSELNAPVSAISSGDGYIYISDTGNRRIRVIDLMGVIDTIAGNGTFISSDGLPPSGAAIGDGGPATSASLSTPGGLAYNSPFLSFADSDYNRVRSVNLGFGFIGTIAGSGRAGYSETDLNYPNGIVIVVGSTTWKVYIVDTRNHLIRMTELPKK